MSFRTAWNVQIGASGRVWEISVILPLVHVIDLRRSISIKVCCKRKMRRQKRTNNTDNGLPHND